MALYWQFDFLRVDFFCGADETAMTALQATRDYAWRKSMTSHTEKAQWAATRMLIRSDLINILKDIEAGQVTEMDFDKLNNYCMVTLVLLSKVEQRTWEACFKQAEISRLFRDEVEDLPS